MTRKKAYVITNKDVIQTYILTSARYDFNVYEKRVLYRIVEMCQSLYSGRKLDSSFSISEKDRFEYRKITMPTSSLLLKEKDTNYDKIKNALIRLKKKELEYETETVWKYFSIVEKVQIEKSTGLLSFEISSEIFDVLSDFSKGFKKFEIKTAMSFSSVYSMRFFELFNNQETALTYSIDELKEMFGLQDKYKRVNDFIKKTIIAAQKELDKKSPFSFKFEQIKTGRKITSIKFIPYKIAKNIDNDLESKRLQKQVSLSWDIPTYILDYLKHEFLFNSQELKNNAALLIDAHKNIDLMYFMSSLKQKVRDKNNIKAYVIGALKSEVYKDVKKQSKEKIHQVTIDEQIEYEKLINKFANKH